jgi:hypothetical protein
MKKQQNFAQPAVTSTYAGEFAGKYIAAALLSARTLDNKYITIMPNVKYKSVIQSIAVDSIVNDASCNFVTSGTVALTERILTPKELQVNLELFHNPCSFSLVSILAVEHRLMFLYSHQSSLICAVA